MQEVIEWVPTILIVLVSLSEWLMYAMQRRTYRSVARLLRARSHSYDATAKALDADGDDKSCAYALGKADAYSRAAMLVAHVFLDGPEPPEDVPTHRNADPKVHP